MDFFQYIPSTQKKKKKIQNNSQNSKNSRTTGHPETLCMELHASLGYFGNLPLPFTINPNLKFFNPLFGIEVGGRGGGVIASDGASINSGLKGGIAAKFREEDWLSWLYFLWCLSHWLEFVIYDSFHEHLQSIKQCSHYLFYFYKKI